MSSEERLFALFDELEQEATAAYGRERAFEVDDRSRAEYRAVTLASRLVASLDAEVALDVEGLGTVRGTLGRTGDGWCLVQAAAADWVVALPAVEAVHGASDRSRPEVTWSPVQRLGLGAALRRLADAEVECVLHLRSGSRQECVVRRVGADFVEVAVRRGRGGRERRSLLVALTAVAAVRSGSSAAV
ncbi:MAG TPA: hypothetical protein VGE77_08435 [Nocardioides sp.]